MPEPTKAEAPAEKPKPAKKSATKSSAPAPILAIILLVFVLLTGGGMRWPHGPSVAEGNPADARAGESLEAARALREGLGLTVAAPGGRRPTVLAPGEPLTIAASHAVLGDRPSSPVYFQAALSIAALILAAIAGGAACGWWGAAGAAALLAFWPEQIEACRVLSPTPLFTAASLSVVAATALFCRETVNFMGMVAAGALAGIATACHPALGLLVPATLLAAASRLDLRGALGVLLGAGVGLAPLAAHRIVVSGSPLIGAERASGITELNGIPLFQGAPGSTLADWVGVDAANLALLVSHDSLLSSPHAAWVLVGCALAAVGALAGLVSARSRAAVVVAVVAIAAFVAIPSMQHRPAGIPLCRATLALAALVAVLGGAGAAALVRLPAVGPLVAMAALGVPALLRGEELRKIVTTPPAWFATAPVLERGGSVDSTPEQPTPQTPTPSPPKNPVEAPQPAPSKPEPAPTAAPPTPTAAPVTNAQISKAKQVVDGEGGATKPTVDRDGDRLLLNLRLEHAKFTSSDARLDAVRMSLKLVRDVPELGDFQVRVQSTDGKTLSTTTVSATKAKLYLPKFEDPFESRQMRDWWGSITVR